MNALLARGFRSLPLLLLAGLPLVAYAQPGIEWEWRSRVAAPDQAEQVIPGEDGGWVILCNQFGADTSRPCASLAFLDGEGRLTRSSPLRHGAENGVYAMTTRPGGFAVAGWMSRQNPERGEWEAGMSLIFTDEEGSIRDARFYESGGVGGAMRGIAPLNRSDFALCGLTSDEDQQSRLTVMVVDSLGDVRSSYHRRQAFAEAIIPLQRGGFAVAGRIDGNGGFSDALLMFFDGDGELLAMRTYGGRQSETFRDMVELPDGGFALAGNRTRSYDDPQPDFWLVRADEEGGTLWTASYGSPTGDYCCSLLATDDGGFLLGGYSGTVANWWAIRVNEQGDSLWSDGFGGERDDHLTDAVSTPDGGYALVGSKRGDACLIKLSRDPVSVGATYSLSPYSLDLTHPYPNPFNGTTRIAFRLPAEAFVRLGVYDISGREAVRLVDGWNPAGDHSALWNSRNAPAGVYALKLEAGGKRRREWWCWGGDLR